MTAAGDRPTPDLDGLTRAADVAALFLAAADNREGFAAVLRQLTMAELPGLFHAAVELGGSMVRYSDQVRARQFLEAIIPAVHETHAEHRAGAGDDPGPAAA